MQAPLSKNMIGGKPVDLLMAGAILSSKGGARSANREKVTLLLKRQAVAPETFQAEGLFADCGPLCRQGNKRYCDLVLE